MKILVTDDFTARLDKLFSSIFGNFVRRPNEAPDPSQTKRRCARCRVKYDYTKTKGATEQFCSVACSDRGPEYSNATSRQMLRHAFRQQAQKEVAAEMGVGPKAANPRRARRRVMLARARKLYREMKAGQ